MKSDTHARIESIAEEE